MRRFRKVFSVLTSAGLISGLLAAPTWAASNAKLPSLEELAGIEQPNIVVILTDDHGWPDVGAQGHLKDVKTPHTDKLAAGGVRFTSGYSTAAQCRPARAGLVTGRYQNKFGLVDNNTYALPWSEYTMAERLRDAGYMTGIAGKWHLQGPISTDNKNPDSSNADPMPIKDFLTQVRELHRTGTDPGEPGYHGFTEYLSGKVGSYVASHDKKGKDLNGPVKHYSKEYRVEHQAEWAVNFIKRHAKKKGPFFLYASLYAPHVPLEAPQKYLDRFPGEMPERRRLALAMISSMDDAVGRITKTLEDEGVRENTLIVYLSDNGAPLKILKRDDHPSVWGGWTGSVNEPWVGEKGMVTEGGIRVPFIMNWPKKIPAGQVDSRPVISLDVVATSVVAAGLELDDRLDGVDLLPYIDGSNVDGKSTADPHDALYWSWGGQYAVRSGDWKYIKTTTHEYLFDVTTEQHEKLNLIDKNPELAQVLKKKIQAWSQLDVANTGFDIPTQANGLKFFDHYLNDKPWAYPAPKQPKQSNKSKKSKQSKNK